MLYLLVLVVDLKVRPIEVFGLALKQKLGPRCKRGGNTRTNKPINENDSQMQILHSRAVVVIVVADVWFNRPNCAAVNTVCKSNYG